MTPGDALLKSVSVAVEADAESYSINRPLGTGPRALSPWVRRGERSMPSPMFMSFIISCKRGEREEGIGGREYGRGESRDAGEERDGDRSHTKR